MRFPPTGKIGIALLAFGAILLAYSIIWLAPRQHVAVDMPISLSAGHIATGTFRVNNGDFYYIEIVFSGDSRSDAGHCNAFSVLATQWTVASNGKVLERGNGPWQYFGFQLGEFVGGKDRCSFDAEIFPGAECLNARKPRLRIRTHNLASDSFTVLSWLSLWSVGIGFALLIRPWILGASDCSKTLRVFPDLVLRNVIPLQRHSPMPRLVGFPDFGLFCGCLLYILMFMFMIAETPQTPLGVPLSLTVPRAVFSHDSPWPDTLSVYLDMQSRFYFNGQAVTRDELKAKLSEELGKRVVWTVYFEADERSDYGDAVFAINTIQKLGAKVIWITPKVREELNRNVVH
jgi:biopolymer transport protein ExbD